MQQAKGFMQPVFLPGYRRIERSGYMTGVKILRCRCKMISVCLLGYCEYMMKKVNHLCDFLKEILDSYNEKM